MKILSILFATLLVCGMASAGQVTQYNQTWSDIDNNAANPWTAIASGNNYVWCPTEGMGVLIVNSTVTSGQWGINLTVKSGFGFRSMLGDKLFTLTKNQIYILGPFETARFKQENNTIQFYSNATRAKAIFIALPS